MIAQCLWLLPSNRYIFKDNVSDAADVASINRALSRILCVLAAYVEIVIIIIIIIIAFILMQQQLVVVGFSYRISEPDDLSIRVMCQFAIVKLNYRNTRSTCEAHRFSVASRNGDDAKTCGAKRGFINRAIFKVGQRR